MPCAVPVLYCYVWEWRCGGDAERRVPPSQFDMGPMSMAALDPEGRGHRICPARSFERSRRPRHRSLAASSRVSGRLVILRPGIRTRPSCSADSYRSIYLYVTRQEHYCSIAASSPLSGLHPYLRVPVVSKRYTRQSSPRLGPRAQYHPVIAYAIGALQLPASPCPCGACCWK